MALREYERRILAEIEHRLSEDDPDLAGHLETFGADDPSFAREAARTGWRPWVVCCLLVAVVVGLLVALVLATPTVPEAENAKPAEVPQTTTVPRTGSG